jgi:hypothetical protein
MSVEHRQVSAGFLISEATKKLSDKPMPWDEITPKAKA